MKKLYLLLILLAFGAFAYADDPVDNICYTGCEEACALQGDMS